jgi:hypothetical protein
VNSDERISVPFLQILVVRTSENRYLASLVDSPELALARNVGCGKYAGGSDMIANIYLIDAKVRERGEMKRPCRNGYYRYFWPHAVFEAKQVFHLSLVQYS